MSESNAAKELARGWDETEKAASGGGAFIKWEPGQVHALTVVGDPVTIEKDWGDGKGPKRRVQVSVFVIGEGIRRWEMSPTVFRDLAEERRDAKEPFGDALIAVKRIGSGTDTKFKIRVQRQLNAKEIAARNEAIAESGGGSAPAPANDDDDNVPF